MSGAIDNPPSLQRLDRDLGLPGIIAPLGTWPSTTQAATANRAFFMRFVPSRVMTVKALRFVVTTAAGSDDACDVGIYSAAMERLRSSGAKTGQLNSQGVKSVEFTSLELQPNTVYFAGLSVGTIGTTAVQFAAINNFNGFYGDLFSSGTTAQRMMLFASTAHPLPASPTIAGTTPTPWVAVAEQ